MRAKVEWPAAGGGRHLPGTVVHLAAVPMVEDMIVLYGPTPTPVPDRLTVAGGAGWPRWRRVRGSGGGTVTGLGGGVLADESELRRAVTTVATLSERDSAVERRGTWREIVVSGARDGPGAPRRTGSGCRAVHTADDARGRDFGGPGSGWIVTSWPPGGGEVR